MALVGGSWVSLHNFNEYDCVAVPNARVLPRFFVTAWRSFSLDSLGESSEEHTRRAIVAGNSRNRACCYIRGTPGAAARGIVSGRPGEQRASCGTSVDWRQSGVRWAVFVAVSCLACSAPHESERATPTRPPPAIDAAASATIIVDAPTIADASMPPRRGARPEAVPIRGASHQVARVSRQSRRHVHPCDWRDRNDWTPERMATCPDGPGALAAFIRRKRPTKDGTATDLETIRDPTPSWTTRGVVRCSITRTYRSHRGCRSRFSAATRASCKCRLPATRLQTSTTSHCGPPTTQTPAENGRNPIHERAHVHQ